MSLQETEETPTDGDVLEISEALAKLSMPPTDLRLSWDPQMIRFQSLHHSVANVPREVTTSNAVTLKHMHDFIRGTSITPTGKICLPQCSEILPENMWIADHYSGTNASSLRFLAITHVICIGNHQYHQDCPPFTSVAHHAVVVPDDLYDSPLVGIIDDTVLFIKDIIRDYPKPRILVHCDTGTNWSPSIAMACLMDVTGCTFQVAFNTVRDRRAATRPHQMVAEAVQQWWNLEQLRPELPRGRGFRLFKWAVQEDKDEE